MSDALSHVGDPLTLNRMTRVVVLPVDLQGCGGYRLAWPAAAVRKIRPDWQVDILRPGTLRVLEGVDGDRVFPANIPDPGTIDLVVAQHVGTPMQVEFLRTMRDHFGAAIVVDADDALWDIDPDNHAHGTWNGSPMHWKEYEAAAELADLVTCTTGVIERRLGKHGRAEVLPNYLPQLALDAHALLPSKRASNLEVAIGWAGFTATHPHDLPVVGDAVARVVADTGAVARVIGDAEGASKAWGVEVERVAPAPLGMKYYAALAALDVGLVPLADSRFNRAKSWLKALEMASQGVPVIASPTEANRALAKDLPILLASTPDEWRAHLTRLVRDETERLDRGRLSREIVAERFTIDHQAQRWAAAWERAIDRRARMAA